MSLKEIFRPCFSVGAAVPLMGFSNPNVQTALKSHYSSLTCENEMKPECLLDAEKIKKNPAAFAEAPALDFSRAKTALDFAKENGIPMRGHTLVWHSQTPDWFFHKDFDCAAPLADREEMLLRMESYIRGVLTWVQTNYPGLIYAWDVVNEAILENGFRESLWTKTVGEDFALWAFRFARKYAAKEVSLFYNDYETYEPWKRDLICSLLLKPLSEEGLIDGMGMQGHLVLDGIDLQKFQDSLEAFGAIVNQVQVTELDIHTPSNSEAEQERLAQTYKALFTILTEACKKGTANVTNVTFWGLNDEYTWLSGFRGEKSFPLLFDDTFQPKPAYWAVAGVPV